MLRYFLKRILIMAPTLLTALVFIFALSRLVPGDLVVEQFEEELDESRLGEEELLITYQRKATRLGLDKPVFYLSIQPAAYPDTLYKIPFRSRREMLIKLLRQNGNWPALEAYFTDIGLFKRALQALPDSIQSASRSSLGQLVNDLQYTTDFSVARVLAKRSSNLLRKDLVLQKAVGGASAHLNQSLNDLIAHPQKGKLFLPSVVWHGFDNQFQHTLLGYFKGDLGVSFQDGRPVSGKIGRALGWTLLLSFFALPIAYLIAIFLGVKMAVKKDSRFDKRANTILFGLYALPSFWVLLVLLYVFSNPDWGMNFISITGMMDLDENSTWNEWLSMSTRQMVLPILCLIYPAMTVLARQMRSSMIQALNQDFVRTARAKGLPEKVVIWKHAFPNAAFPLITFLGSLLPDMVAGSILVENIFNIPGMGQLLIDSIGTQDWPVVFGIIILGALLSMVSLLLVDLAYAWLDPRVRFNQDNSMAKA